MTLSLYSVRFAFDHWLSKVVMVNIFFCFFDPFAYLWFGISGLFAWCIIVRQKPYNIDLGILFNKHSPNNSTLVYLGVCCVVREPYCDAGKDFSLTYDEDVQKLVLVLKVWLRWLSPGQIMTMSSPIGYYFLVFFYRFGTYLQCLIHMGCKNSFFFFLGIVFPSRAVERDILLLFHQSNIFLFFIFTLCLCFT